MRRHRQPITHPTDKACKWEDCAEQSNVTKLHDKVHVVVGKVLFIRHHFVVELDLADDLFSLGDDYFLLIGALKFILPKLFHFVNLAGIATSGSAPSH